MAMDRNRIIKTLREYKKEHGSQYGIPDIGIFGPAARDDAGEASDVDVVVRTIRPDLLMPAGIKNDPEEKLQKPVDIVTYWSNMDRFLKNRIDREALYA